MTLSHDAIAPNRSVWTGSIRSGWIVAFLALWLGLSQMLLWRFLDITPWWAYGVGVALLGAAVAWILSAMRGKAAGSVSLRALGFSLALAFLLLIMAGEGRFFYSNPDWQVRDALLRDMAIHPWPFVYTARASADVLRAPIGMYFLPSLAFKQWGAVAGDLMLLLQNGMLFGAMLALGSSLFATGRARAISAITFLAFSGLDVIGAYLVHHRISGHLDGWLGLEYSSTITLLFWVPHHAFAGWIGALAFLLWRAGRMPLGVLMALIPLTALWSPLGMIGGLPFVTLAVGKMLIARKLRTRDILLPALTSLLCVPSLLYLGAAGDEVGARVFPIDPFAYLAFHSIETLPFLIPVGLALRGRQADHALFGVVAACLLLMPFLQIGWSVDFMMRASIPALAILAVLVAECLIERRTGRYWLLLALVIGSVTGIAEIRRGLILPPSPRGTCSFFRAWEQSFTAYPKGSYLAPLDQMPAIIRPAHPTRISAAEPAHCWSRPWTLPSQVR